MCTNLFELRSISYNNIHMHVRRIIIYYSVFINALISINDELINYTFNLIFIADNPLVNITSQKHVIELIYTENGINVSHNLFELLSF